MDVGQPENQGNLVNTIDKNKCIVMPTEMKRKNEMPFNTFKEHKDETEQQFVQFC
jgi:hypothetical protein